MIGTTIGNYVVRSKLGEGGMGAVYLAEHARLGRRVAVKVLLPEMARSKDVVGRFFNEAKAATDIENDTTSWMCSISASCPTARRTS